MILSNNLSGKCLDDKLVNKEKWEFVKTPFNNGFLSCGGGYFFSDFFNEETKKISKKNYIMTFLDMNIQ